MSLPGKQMKIGGWNYHVSDQGSGDKGVVMLVTTALRDDDQ
mgnify:FL=1